MVLIDQGYEILVEGDEVWCANRRTWPLGYVAGIAVAVAGLGAVIGALALVRAYGLTDSILAAILLGVTVVLTIPAMGVRRVLRARRTQPIESVRDLLILDRPSGVLRKPDGEILARLEDLRVAVHVDWMTRGLLRLVRLRWPTGQRVVFRSLSRGRARQAASMITDATKLLAE